MIRMTSSEDQQRLELTARDTHPRVCVAEYISSVQFFGSMKRTCRAFVLTYEQKSLGNFFFSWDHFFLLGPFFPVGTLFFFWDLFFILGPFFSFVKNLNVTISNIQVLT